METILPKPLIKGDTIGLITPSSPLADGRLEAGREYFEKLGYKIKIGKHNTKARRFLAGSDEERAEDVTQFFLDPDVRALIATGGGYGSQRILPLLDYDVIRQNPKILIGSSDTTALSLGLLSQAGLATFTGFTCGDVHDNEMEPFFESTMLSCLEGRTYNISEGIPVSEGTIKGPLIGGNLEVITALVGTPYMPSLKGSILLIEEVRTEPYQIDCKLSQLKLAGILDQVAGVIFCHLEKCEANYFPDRDGTSDDVITEYASSLSVPCIKNFRYGHGPDRSVLPIGYPVTLNATDGSVKIDF